LNVVLRLAATGGKFLLVIFLLKFLDSKDYAVYILMIASVGYIIFPLGLEFYTYSCREIVSATPAARTFYIKNQFVVYLFSYIVFLPIIISIFVFELLPWKIIYWFYFILIFEHLNQEVYRLLIALSEQLQASIILFIRQGLWPFLLIIMFLSEFVDKTLHAVLAVWGGVSLVAFFLGLTVLSKHIKDLAKARVDKSWILRGLKVSLPFLISTAGVNGVLVIDKYIVEFNHSLEYLASYSLYLSISLSLMLIIDAWIVQFTYQKMIILVNQNDFLALRKAGSLMIYSIIFISVIHAIILFSLLATVIEWTGKKYLVRNHEIIYYLVTYSIINALSLMPHCVLYALKFDKWLTVTGFLNLPIFLTVSYSLYLINFENAVPLSLLLTAFFSFVTKFVGYKLKIQKAESFFVSTNKTLSG
jgi:hypothetical protein